MSKEEMRIKHNENMRAIQCLCDYIINNRHYMNDWAIFDKLHEIKAIAGEYFIGDLEEKE